MKNHFVVIRELVRHEKPVEILSSSVGQDELLAYLRPRILRIYNQFMRDVPEAAERAGLKNIAKTLRKYIPDTLNLKKAEFGEIIATLYLESFKGHTVPVYKHSHKTSPNVPFHGLDCLSFIVAGRDEGEQVLVFFCEAKTTSQEKKHPTVSYKIRDSFRILDGDSFDRELAFIKKHLLATGRESNLLQMLDKVNFENVNGYLTAVLVVENSKYEDTYLDPFCKEDYVWGVEAAVIGFDNLGSLFLAAMDKDNGV